MVNFASRLRELRKTRGLSQADVFLRSGVHPTRYERGLQPSIEVIVKLARALGVNPRELADPAIAYAEVNSRTREVSA